MQYRIIGARARPDFTVELTWEGGDFGTVDFRRNVESGGVCAPMGDPDVFVAEMKLVDDGHALAWSDEIEFSADSLWYRLHPEDLQRDYPDVAAE